MSSADTLAAEKEPVAQLTEEEKVPAPPFFSYMDIGGQENNDDAGTEEATPVFSVNGSEVSLTPEGNFLKGMALKANGTEQISLDAVKVIKQASYIQTIISQAKENEQQQDKYTEVEKELIAKVVYAEARGECFDGQVAVAQVVINRYKSGEFGSTIKKIVYKKNQFAVGRKYTDPCMKAVEYAIENMPYPENMYFFRVSKNKHWRNFVYYVRIGNHSFYCGK